MKTTGIEPVLKKNIRLLPRCGLLWVLVIMFFTTGCSTMDGLLKKPVADEPAKEQVAVPQQEVVPDKVVMSDEGVKQEQASMQKDADQITLLQSSQKDLQKQVHSLNRQLKAEKIAQVSLVRRLEIAQAAREDAIREVVRMRARIQGMASQAGASAMFAEARVILDRMEEEAFNDQALADLDLARSYMDRGKGALDTGNPGGAAYLFDQIPGLYEGMKKDDPRRVKVRVSVAALRVTPTRSSKKVATLYIGTQATGVVKNKDWIKIKTSTGQTGWIMASQVQ
jgi:hypothetical protein